MKKISAFLWFNNNAMEAMKFYRSIFKDTKVIEVHRKGSKVLWVHFQLHGQDFMGLNGGPHFKFTPAISFFVSCRDQKEVDYFWEKLSRGGRKSQCGWLQDKFGLSWQIIPTALGQLMGDKDKKKADRVFDAMMKMSKIDIAALKRAYHNK
jgi:predicted 3-demethylubiquinone-9 3-methyltransferase (glyoxalase superfamily)